jgi:putative endopeptidase
LRVSLKRSVVVRVLAALPLAGVIVVAQSDRSRPSVPAPRHDASPRLLFETLDREIAPCADFYQFACGGWAAKNALPADRRVWGRFQEVQDRNFGILRGILETSSREPSRQKAADYYSACVDQAAIDRQGIAPLEAERTRIASMDTKRDLPKVLAHLHSIGATAFFRFENAPSLRDATMQNGVVSPGGLALPTRDYYSKEDPKSVALRETYARHVERVLTLTGETAARAVAASAAVLQIETALARVTPDNVTLRDPGLSDHPSRIVELLALAPAFDWRQYLAAAEVPATDIVNVTSPAFVTGLNAVIEASSLDDIEGYLRWHLVHASAEMLPRAIADADFDFFLRTLTGQQQPTPRWRRCIALTDQRVGEALGKAFIDEAFGPDAKADAERLMDGVSAAMRLDIDVADWMAPTTKRAALIKLEAVIHHVGHPETWRDYSSLRVARGDALGNQHRGVAFTRRYDLQKIGRRLDRHEWLMTPSAVNASYSQGRVNISLPAGILQPPFYDARRDAAFNYGAIGSFVGHELTHGFDDRGRRFDANGSIRDWWTPADSKAFDERTSCLADQYSEYVVAGDTHINGRLTLSENTADNGGVRLALMAYLAGPRATASAIDGFSPEQRFFIGYAQVWCENRTPEFERFLAGVDTHASGRYRVNGVVSNMPEFRSAFSCRADAPMVRPQPCRVW